MDGEVQLFDGDERKRLIEEAWQQFQENPDAESSGVRPVILESWRRSRGYGINPEGVHKIVLSDEELAERIENNREMYDIAIPLMETLASLDEGSGFLALLCDREGYVLKTIGDPDAIAKASESMLVEGAARGEGHIGTNAIGTCIYLQQPVKTWANEHYYRKHNIWACTSAPIFDAEGELIGALCLSGYWNRTTFHTTGMVVSETEVITKQLALRQSLHQITSMRNKLDKIIELMSYGLVVVERSGVITEINSLAILLLGIKGRDKESIVGTNIAEYFPRGRLNLSSYLRKVQAEDTFTFDTVVGTLDCSVNVLAGDDPDDPSEVVLTMRKMEHLHKMINRMVGSSARFTIDDIVGQSQAITAPKRLVSIAAPYQSNVLLTGESGTGKELFAQAIHNASPRAAAPFIAINCGALPRSLIESELFGYEGGAFTGSKREGQAGKFELANGGTIFLDEIGDMPFDVQANLLRVVQSREIVRLGGKKAISIDVRIISATNKDLEEGIREGSFREDLYYRLNVFDIKIPPLRDRTGDVRELCDYMLLKYATSFGKSVLGFTDDAYQMLASYGWPGNVRELENVVERTVLVAQGQWITVNDLPDYIVHGKPLKASTQKAPRPLRSAAQSEELLIREALQQFSGNIRKVSMELGLSRGTLYSKIKKYGIDLDSLRD